MARTEAQKAAERRYDKTKRGVRGEIWCIIGYPESLPNDWLDYLDELHIEVIISPLHDADINANGETKKPHYHIVLIFSSQKSLAQVKEISDRLNAPSPKKQDSKRGIVRYLCHLDNPSKAQYNEDDVVCLGGADYRAIVSMSRDKYEVIGEILDWVDDNREIHGYAFNKVVRYAQKNNEKWFRGLCDNCGWIVKEYLQSAYWDEKERNPLMNRYYG